MGNAIGIGKPKLNSTLVESYDKQDKGDERSGVLQHLRWHKLATKEK